MLQGTLAKEVGARLRQARLDAGYKTISDFISKHPLPKSTYNQYEIGARSLSIESAIKFAQLFKTNLIWLITGKGSQYYSDDEIIEKIPEPISELEFLSIVKSEKKLPAANYKAVKKKIFEQDIHLLASIFSKVLNCYQIKARDINLNHVSEIALGIYFDSIRASKSKEELRNIIDTSISTLSRTISCKKNYG